MALNPSSNTYLLCDMGQLFNFFFKFQFLHPKSWDDDNHTESNLNYQVVNLAYYPVEGSPLTENRAGFFFFILTLI